VVRGVRERDTETQRAEMGGSGMDRDRETHTCGVFIIVRSNLKNKLDEKKSVRERRWRLSLTEGQCGWRTQTKQRVIGDKTEKAERVRPDEPLQVTLRVCSLF
jgi:hypothetical protein